MFAPEVGFRRRNTQWRDVAVFGIICALVITIFARSAEPGFLESASPRSQDAYYNLLVQGFRVGQLNVKQDAPPGLARLANPYDPAANAYHIWRKHYLSFDMSYYKGKLYLYFGVTPALVLFWPYAALTGQYLPQKTAVVIFYALGFLFAAGLLRSIWRHHFSETSVWVFALGLLTLGLATGILEILSRCDVYEVAMSCGFTFTMLALTAVWCALHEPKREVLWLLVASMAYGLAIGSRPSLLLGAIILLAPVVRAWHEATESGSGRRVGVLLAAAMGPVMLIGLGLVVYNTLRFDNPFEFGWHYQLTGYRSDTVQQFSLHYLWFNLWFYFLEPMRWTGHFPFLQSVLLSPVPPGYFGVGEPYCGILFDYPLVWLALASPLAWHCRAKGEVSGLRAFVVPTFSLFVICALTLCLFFSASSRYEMDFLPALMLLAIVGIFGLERALAHLPVWRLAARLVWGLLLTYSLVFNLLATIEAHAAADYALGNSFLNDEQVGEATEHFRRAVALQPESATFRIGLARALCQEGQTGKAIVQYQAALAFQPDSALAYNGLGNALYQRGEVAKAIAQFQKASEIKPDFADPHINLGYILLQTGRTDDAMIQYRAALALQPQSPGVHNDLGYCLLLAGRVDEAVEQFRKTLEIQPDNYAAYDNLGYALRQKGMAIQAVACYQKVIELYPESAPAKVELAWMLATWPDPAVRNGTQAIALAREAETLCRSDNPVILRTLAAAYAEAGQFPEAVSTAREALALAITQSAAGLTNALQKEIELYQTNSPCRSTGE